MKLFGKELTAKQKKELLMQFISVILTGIFATTLAVVSFAWFSSNRYVRQSGMSVVVSNETVDLLVERASRYESNYEGISDFKTALAADGYSFSVADTSPQMPSPSNYLGQEISVAAPTFQNLYYLMPGAYGTLTFYVRPRPGKDLSTVRIRLLPSGYKNEVDENTDQTIITKVTSTRVLDLLKGHILFFRNRSYDAQDTFQNYIYSDLITDEGFLFEMRGDAYKCDEQGKTDCYKIVLYWEWPMTFADIEDNISTTSPAETKRFPAEVGTYVDAHPSYFFPFAVSETDESGKSDAYNDGDQTIGDGVNYFVAYLSVA